MNMTVQQVLDAFDALPEGDKHQAAVEIFRRISPATEGDVPEVALGVQPPWGPAGVLPRCSRVGAVFAPPGPATRLAWVRGGGGGGVRGPAGGGGSGGGGGLPAGCFLPTPGGSAGPRVFRQPP